MHVVNAVWMSLFASGSTTQQPFWETIISLFTDSMCMSISASAALQLLMGQWQTELPSNVWFCYLINFLKLLDFSSGQI